MKIKGSSTLIFRTTAEGIAGYNYLSGNEFDTDCRIFDDLNTMKDGLIIQQDKLSSYSDAIEQSIVVEEGSPYAAKEIDFAKKWKWGIPTAAFHFSLLDRNYEGTSYNETVQLAKIANRPSPNLYARNVDSVAQIPLEKPSKHNEVLNLMAARRTCRESGEAEVTTKMLGDILYSGVGITGFTENCVGALPLKMTPSAGARNPFEVYIFVKSIEQLEPGVYHYSAYDNDLALVAPLPDEQLSSLVGNQEWVDTKNCLIVLVADFERTMWKYEDPNAYRAILVEAGHIAQNMMLTATKETLSLCPTMALAHSKITIAIGENEEILKSPIYALALGSLDAPVSN